MRRMRYAPAILVGAFLFFLPRLGGVGTVNAQEHDKPNVLLIASEIDGYQNKIKYYLEQFKDQQQHPIFDISWYNLYPYGSNDAYHSLPTLGDYDCIVTWSNLPFRTYPGYISYAQYWGNKLADYVDAGGAVIICTFCFNDERALAGDIFGEGYSPLTNNGDWNHMNWSEFDIPREEDKSQLQQELYADVDKLGCGWRDYCSLENWAGGEHFSYLDGEYAFAYSEDYKVAAIDMYPGSAFTDISSEHIGKANSFNCFYDWKDDYASTTDDNSQVDDFPEFLRNVILWLVNEYNP